MIAIAGILLNAIGSDPALAALIAEGRHNTRPKGSWGTGRQKSLRAFGRSQPNGVQR
jgi:hypothetical protein